MTYYMQLKDVPTQHIASVRLHTPFSDLGSTFAGTVHGIVDRVSPMGAWPRGSPLAIYYNTPFSAADVDVEIAVPIASNVALEDEGPAFQTRDLPGGRVAYTMHNGSYGGIGAAYDELIRWIAREGMKPIGPPREIYLVGPEQTESPSEYLTEIEVPIE